MLRGYLLVCFLGAVTASLSISKLNAKPEKFKDVEGCYIEDLDEVIPYDTSKPSPTGCIEFRCDKEWVTIAGCGVAVSNPPLELVEDKNKPYPDCCPKLERFLAPLKDNFVDE